jgi:hypothetical protein
LKIAENKSRAIMIGIGDQIKEFALAFAPIKQMILQGLSDIIAYIKPKFQPLIDFVQKDIMGLVQSWSKGIGAELGAVITAIWTLTTPVREWTMLTIKGISLVFQTIMDSVNWTVNAISDIGDTLGLWEGKKIDLFNTEKTVPQLENAKGILLGMIDTLDALGQTDSGNKMANTLVSEIDRVAIASDDYAKQVEASFIDASGNTVNALMTIGEQATLSSAIASGDFETASQTIARVMGISTDQASKYLEDIQKGAKIGSDGVISYISNGANKSKIQLQGLANYANVVLSNIGQAIQKNAHWLKYIGMDPDRLLSTLESTIAKKETVKAPTGAEDTLDTGESKGEAKARKSAEKVAKAEQKEKEKAEKEEIERRKKQVKDEYDAFKKDLDERKKEQDKYFKDIEKASKDIGTFIEQDNYNTKVDLLKAYQKIEIENSRMTEEQRALLRETYIRKINKVDADLQYETQKKINQFTFDANMNIINKYSDDVFDITQTRISYMTKAMKSKQTGENIEETYDKALQNISQTAKDTIKALNIDIDNFNIKLGTAQTNINRLRNQWDVINSKRDKAWDKNQDKAEMEYYDNLLKDINDQIVGEQGLERNARDSIETTLKKIQTTKDLAVAQKQQAETKKTIDKNQLSREANLLSDDNAIQLRKDKIRLAEYMKNYKYWIDGLLKYNNEFDKKLAEIEENDYKRRLEINRKIQSDFLKFGIGFFTKKTDKEIQEIINKLKIPGSSEEPTPEEFIKNKLAEINQLKMLYEEVNTGYEMSATGTVKKMSAEKIKEKQAEIFERENELAKVSDAYKLQLFKNRTEKEKALIYTTEQKQRERDKAYHDKRMQEISAEQDITYKGPVQEKGESDKDYQIRQQQYTQDEQSRRALTNTFNAINNISNSTTTALNNLNTALEDGTLSLKEFVNVMGDVGGVLNSLSNIRGLENLGPVGAGIQAGVGVFNLGKAIGSAVFSEGSNAGQLREEAEERKRIREEENKQLYDLWSKYLDTRKELREEATKLGKDYEYLNKLQLDLNDATQEQLELWQFIAKDSLERAKKTLEVINDLLTRQYELVKKIAETYVYSEEVAKRMQKEGLDKLYDSMAKFKDIGTKFGFDMSWLEPPTIENWEEWFMTFESKLLEFYDTIEGQGLEYFLQKNDEIVTGIINNIRTIADKLRFVVYDSIRNLGDDILAYIGGDALLEKVITGDAEALEKMNENIANGISKLTQSVTAYQKGMTQYGWTQVGQDAIDSTNAAIESLNQLSILINSLPGQRAKADLIKTSWTDMTTALEEMGVAAEDVENILNSMLMMEYNKFKLLESLGLAGETDAENKQTELDIIKNTLDTYASLYGINRDNYDTEKEFIKALLEASNYNENIVSLYSEQKGLLEDMKDINDDMNDATLERIRLLEETNAITKEEAARRRAERLRQMIQEAEASGQSQDYINNLYLKLAEIIKGTAGEGYQAGKGGAITEFHDGIDRVPETGIYKLKKDEMVFSPNDSEQIRKLKSLLNSSINNKAFTGMPMPNYASNIVKNNTVTIGNVTVQVASIQDLQPDKLAKTIQDNLKVKNAIIRIANN